MVLVEFRHSREESLVGVIWKVLSYHSKNFAPGCSYLDLLLPAVSERCCKILSTRQYLRASLASNQ